MLILQIQITHWTHTILPLSLKQKVQTIYYIFHSHYETEKENLYSSLAEKKKSPLLSLQI